MTQPEDDYDMLNSGISSAEPSTHQIGSTSTSGISKYFVPPTGYDWEGQAEKVRREREGRGGSLIERMVESLGLDDFEYPPTSYSDFQTLISTIQASSAPRHDRDSLLYYLLLDLHGSSVEESPSQGKEMVQSFVRRRGLPAWRVGLVDGLWKGDHGLWKEAIRHLTNPSIPIQSYIPILLIQLQTLPSTNSSCLTLKLLNYTQTPLATDEMRDVYVRALAQKDFGDAWFWVRNEDWKEGLREEVGELEEEEGEEERKRLIRVLVEFCLIPQPRRRPLEALLTLPIDGVEHTILTSYLLNPPSNIPSSSYELLHDLLNLRLMSHGEYAAAIDLDKRVDSLNRVRHSDLTRERRDMIRDMIALLPDVQRKMLSMDVVDGGVKEGRKPNGVHEDLEMSWEPLDTSSSTPKDVQHPTPRKNVPLSASEVLRTSSTPNIAIYQAVMQSNPASPVPGRFSPAVPPTNRQVASRESPRSLVLAQGSPKAEALSPYGSPRRSQLEPEHTRGLRNVSSSSALFRQVATAHMNAVGPTRDLGSPGPSRSMIQEEKQGTIERPSRRFRTLGAWGTQEEETPKAMDTELHDQEDAEMGNETQTNGDEQLSHFEEISTVPGSYEWAAPVEQPQPREKQTSSPTPREEPPKRTRRTRASTQPVSPPKPVRKTPRRSAKSKVDEMAGLPGTFPGAPQQQPSEEPVDQEPPAARTRHARSMSRSETRPAPPTDDETKANRRTKRPRGPPPAPSANARRTTRGQSVVSSVASELGDESVMSGVGGLRRSSRLSSAAPTSPSMSERFEIPIRTRRQAREASETHASLWHRLESGQEGKRGPRRDFLG